MIIAINGSPRKKGNTATLLGYVLEGARSKGAPTELVHLCGIHFYFHYFQGKLLCLVGFSVHFYGQWWKVIEVSVK